MLTEFRQLNTGWGADPNCPEEKVVTHNDSLVLEFTLNHFVFPDVREGQRAHIEFRRASRYRLGPTNDEGFYTGKCRFSRCAPRWGEFYELVGDARLEECPNDWLPVLGVPTSFVRHFLFYLRDATFECEAESFEFKAIAWSGDAM